MLSEPENKFQAHVIFKDAWESWELNSLSKKKDSFADAVLEGIQLIKNNSLSISDKETQLFIRDLSIPSED